MIVKQFLTGILPTVQISLAHSPLAFVPRDTLAKGAERILAEYAGGVEVRPWIEGHSDPI